ncbi:hypothetical protein V6N13_118081 [Hibiscus sabdariffa]
MLVQLEKVSNDLVNGRAHPNEMFLAHGYVTDNKVCHPKYNVNNSMFFCRGRSLELSFYVKCINVGKPNSSENQIPEDDRQEEHKLVDSENLVSKDRQENGSNCKIHVKPPNDDNETGGKDVEVTHIQFEF